MSAAPHNAAAGSPPSSERSNKRARSDRDADELRDNDAEQPTHSAAHVAPRRYRHALESIFAFLPLADLSRVLAVDRSWSAAVHSMPSICASLPRLRALLSVIAASGLVTHIAELGSPHTRTWLGDRDLLVLRESFVSLTALDCILEISSAASLVFSHKLRSVRIELTGSTPAVIQAALFALGQLSQLTDLAVVFFSWFPELDFSPLRGAASLRHLRLKYLKEQSSPTAAHINQLRLLAHLQTMEIPRLDRESLESLLRSPHQLRWEQMDRVYSVDEITSAALSTLPTLTHLSVSVCGCVAFLHSLPRLQTLDLRVLSEYVSADEVVVGLACCPKLSSLTLGAPVESAHMGAILAALPQLTALTIRDCRMLESLSFLRSIDWTQRAALQQLTINCPNPASRLRVDFLTSLECLRGLTSLTLVHTHGAPLDETTLGRLRPPSELFPLLTSFKYQHV